MADLTRHVTSGDTVVFDRDYHNQLVDQLETLRQAKRIDLEASTESVSVSPDSSAEWPIEPGAVRIDDATAWGLPASESIRIRWTLEKEPGHIATTASGTPQSELTTAPGDSIYWSWARTPARSANLTNGSGDYYATAVKRDWNASLNGRLLPHAATVQAVAESLTLETTQKPVESLSDLSSKTNDADGDKRLVRGQSAVYIFRSSVFDGKVSAEAGLETVPGSEVSDGSVYVVDDGSFGPASYFQLDTSITSPGTDDVAWDPNQDTTNEGVWVFQNDDPEVLIDADEDGTKDSYWEQSVAVEDSDYALVGQTEQSIVVERGYDPSAQADVTPYVQPQRDVAYLNSQGTATIGFDDFTGPGTHTNVSRSVTASIHNVGTDPVTLGANADVADITATNNLSFDVTTNTAGLLEVTITYDTGSSTKETTKAVRVRPSFEPSAGSNTDPSVPPISVNKGNGVVGLKVGTEEEISGLTDEGPLVDAERGLYEGGTRALARRLGADEIMRNDPRVEMLREAGALLVAALGQPGGEGLRRWSLDLPQDVASVGQVVMLGPDRPTPTGVIRLTDRVGQGENIDNFEGVGVVEDQNETAVHITGNGDEFLVEYELAFGDNSNAGFPTDVIHSTAQTVPGMDLVQFPLPRRVPETASDRWYARFRPAARWKDGRRVRGSWTDWKVAEEDVTGAADAELIADSGTGLTLGINAEHPVGHIKWTTPAADQIPDSEALRGPLPETLPVSPDPSVWGEPGQSPRLKVALAQTKAGGSVVRGAIEKFDLSPPGDARNALPRVSISSSSVPSEWESEVVDGMIIDGSGDTTWIGVGNSWIQINS